MASVTEAVATGAEAESVPEGLCEEERLLDLDTVEGALWEGEAVGEEDAEGDGVPLEVGVGVRVPVREGVSLQEGEGVRDAEAVPVREGVTVAEPVSLSVPEAEVEGVGVGEAELESEPVGVREGVGVGMGVPVGVELALLLGVAEGEGVGGGVKVGLCVLLRLPVGEGEGEPVAVKDAVGAPAVAVADALGGGGLLGVMLGVGVLLGGHTRDSTRWLLVSTMNAACSVEEKKALRGLLRRVVRSVPTPVPGDPACPSIVMASVPGRLMRRRRWLLASATKSPPAPSCTTRMGALKVDPPPMAFVDPATPEPARVLTVPESRLTRRMRCEPVSATYRSVPLGPRVTPLGTLKMALPRGPSRKPALPVPTRVDTLPAGEMERMR
jgi:hypothetical protein